MKIKFILLLKEFLFLGGSIKCIPLNYKNSSVQNEDEGLIGGKFPSLSWSKDIYTNWLTQNGVNIGLGIVSSAITMVAGVGMMTTGVGSLAGASSVVSGAMGIANIMGEKYQHSICPTTAEGNINGGDINTCSDRNGFSFYKMSIKQEYAKIIDKFFSAFGYKINDVKVPNITGRRNWNYVKTVDANIIGDIPQEDLQTLKDILNSGVTFWHNASTFLDYSQSNPIV